MRLGRSLKLGVQRLRAEFGKGAPLGKREKKQLEERVRQVAAQALGDAKRARFKMVVGSSGTILALGQAAHRLAGGEPWTSATGHVVSLSDLRALTERLLSLPAHERSAIGGIDAMRADTIHVGAVLLVTLLELAGVDRITLCDAALREGLVLDYLESRAEAIRAYEVVSDIRRHSVAELAARCGQSGPHPERVAHLSLQLFDQLAQIHGLSDDDRRLLEYGAILHDIGQHIGYERHEHHAAYIIKNGDLRGFSDEERNMLALIARYHRKSRPKRKDQDFAALSAKRRKALTVLAGIVRLADGLDRSHHQLISDVRVKLSDDRVRIISEAVGDAELEIWGARRKSRLLERALKRKIELEVEAVASLRQIA